MTTLRATNLPGRMKRDKLGSNREMTEQTRIPHQRQILVQQMGQRHDQTEIYASGLDRLALPLLAEVRPRDK